MIVKKLHVGSKVFIKDPYVVKLVHPESTVGNVNMAEFRRILRQVKGVVGDTWGYSNPEDEVISMSKEDAAKFNVGNFQLYSMYNFVYCSYWVFKDQVDALQFLLVAGNNASHVHIWPSSRTFAITEFVDMSDQ